MGPGALCCSSCTWTHLSSSKKIQRNCMGLKIRVGANSGQKIQINRKPAAATAKSRQSCPTLCDPIDGSPQAPPSLGFSRQEHWSGLPFPSPTHESEKGK